MKWRWLVALFVLWALNVAQAGWQNTQWNSSVTINPLIGGGFSCKVPGSNGHLNSVQHGPVPIALRQYIFFKCQVVKISGLPKFVSLDRSTGLAPNCRILLQRKGDDWSCSGGKEHYRWWSAGTNCVFLKADGIQRTYNVQVTTTNNWSNCWGKPASQYPSQFKACLANLDNIELVFGGGNSFSHGVYVAGGVAKYKLLEMRVHSSET